MPLPRTLTLIALLWAIASLLSTVGPRVPIQPTTLSYTPGIRSLVVMLAFGAFAVYPVARLATARGLWPNARIALDGVVMTAMFTVLFWPLQLVTYWPRATGIALWATVVGWMWVGVASVGLGARVHSTWGRAAISLGCPVLLAGGALLDALGVSAPWPALLGPVVAVLELTTRSGTMPAPDWAIACMPWMIAAVSWAFLCRARPRAFAAQPIPR